MATFWRDTNLKNKNWSDSFPIGLIPNLKEIKVKTQTDTKFVDISEVLRKESGLYPIITENISAISVEALKYTTSVKIKTDKQIILFTLNEQNEYWHQVDCSINKEEKLIEINVELDENMSYRKGNKTYGIYGTKYINPSSFSSSYDPIDSIGDKKDGATGCDFKSYQIPNFRINNRLVTGWGFKEYAPPGESEKFYKDIKITDIKENGEMFNFSRYKPKILYMMDSISWSDGDDNKHALIRGDFTDFYISNTSTFFRSSDPLTEEYYRKLATKNSYIESKCFISGYSIDSSESLGSYKNGQFEYTIYPYLQKVVISPVESITRYSNDIVVSSMMRDEANYYLKFAFKISSFFHSTLKKEIDIRTKTDIKDNPEGVWLNSKIVNYSTKCVWSNSYIRTPVSMTRIAFGRKIEYDDGKGWFEYNSEKNRYGVYYSLKDLLIGHDKDKKFKIGLLTLKRQERVKKLIPFSKTVFDSLSSAISFSPKGSYDNTYMQCENLLVEYSGNEEEITQCTIYLPHRFENTGDSHLFKSTAINSSEDITLNNMICYFTDPPIWKDKWQINVTSIDGTTERTVTNSDFFDTRVTYVSGSQLVGVIIEQSNSFSSEAEVIWSENDNYNFEGYYLSARDAEGKRVYGYQLGIPDNHYANIGWWYDNKFGDKELCALWRVKSNEDRSEWSNGLVDNRHYKLEDNFLQIGTGAVPGIEIGMVIFDSKGNVVYRSDNIDKFQDLE